VFDQFGGLHLVANGEGGICPWSDISGVTMKPKSELSDRVLAKC
jgi:hypothetical protein